MESIGESLARNPALREEFGLEKLDRVAAVIASHRTKPGSLIPVLEEVQDTLGYIPPPIQEKVALGLGLSLSEVHGVVTFYHYFTTVPRGRHTIRCCLGTACYVRGGQQTVNRISDMLGIKAGETTEDRRFSLETVRCLGACGLAPAMVVDEETFPRVKPTKLTEVLKDFA